MRGGSRASVPSCLIEARKRRTETGANTGPRFGFTVTKKLGNAVTRNRIRRRLRAAIGQLATKLAEDGFDYVIVARKTAFDRPYADVIADISRAFAIVHSPTASKPAKRPADLPRKVAP